MTIRVKIENFQSIQEAEFEIDKYTVLTGPSNSGKSAICRAIEGALFNRSGDGFVRNGEKFAQVTIQTDSQEIVWTKGSGKNHYTVNGNLFDKVGTDVPQDIINLGFKDIELSRSKLRPQMGTDQFDILFLIREQGSLISEVFSVLGRLDVITKAGKECGTDLKGRKSLLKTRYDDLATIDRKLGKYQGFEKIVLASESLEIDDQDIKTERSNLEGLSNTFAKYRGFKKDILGLSVVSKLKAPKDIDSAEIQSIKALSETKDKLQTANLQIQALGSLITLNVPEPPSEKLVSLVSQLKSLSKKYHQTVQQIHSLDSLADMPTPADISSSEFKKLEGLKKAQQQILGMAKIIDQTVNDLRSVSSTIEAQESELHELLDSLEECPLCQQTVAKSYVH